MSEILNEANGRDLYRGKLQLYSLGQRPHVGQQCEYQLICTEDQIRRMQSHKVVQEELFIVGDDAGGQRMPSYRSSFGSFGGHTSIYIHTSYLDSLAELRASRLTPTINSQSKRCTA